jgi:AcrR family transcriptional regulator
MWSSLDLTPAECASSFAGMGRKAKPGSNEGLKSIILAARHAFAAHGFDGASLRQISAEAGVLHTAMLYHFPTKDALWKAVMADMFEALEARFAGVIAAQSANETRDLARALVREFVMFCAECPELHRIMTSEGRSETDRLTWLVETYSKRLFQSVAAMVPAANPLLSDPVRLYYAIIGLSASVFTLAPEYRRLSGKDPFGTGEVATTADIVEAIVFGQANSESGPPHEREPTLISSAARSGASLRRVKNGA